MYKTFKNMNNEISNEIYDGNSYYQNNIILYIQLYY